MRRHLASLVDDFRSHATETAVVVHRGVRRYATSYGELAELAGRFAAELERRGIGPGDRMVLWGANSAEWIGAFFGCLLRGVLVVPLDAAGSPQFAERVIRDVAPGLIVGDEALLDQLKPEAATLVLPKICALLPEQPDFLVSDAVGKDAAFQIVFTSGTTSEPKGIVHTHRNVLASLLPIEAEIERYRKYERWVHPLRFLHTLPLSHVFGQFMGLWIPAVLGAEVHFTDALDPARQIDLIRRERISVLVAVPRVSELLRAHLLRQFPSLAQDLTEAEKLSLVKRLWRFRAVHRALGWKFWAVISGGATVPATLERFWNRLGFAMIQGYGMTETAALVTLNHPFRIGQGSLGKVLPNREVRLSETGEILVRGEMVSTARWRQGRIERHQDEWLATGDLAEKNDAGDLRFVGRVGDVIVTSNGLNIYPSDVETAMLAQPGVRGCVVVGCDLESGPQPVAVVLFAGEDESLQGAVNAANGTLSEYQQVRRVLRWPEADFPYTSTGKVLRRVVRDWACSAMREQRAKDVAGNDPLLHLIAEITGEQAASRDEGARLSEDLHLDSLGRVQLGSLIEQRMGVELAEEQLASLETLGQLRRLLSASGESGIADAASNPPQALNEAPLQQETMRSRDVVLPDAPDTERHIYLHWPWSWPVRVLRIVFLEVVLRPLVGVLLSPRVVAPAQMLPDGPMLLIANHVTSLDAALVLYALPGPLRRRVAIAMSGEMLLDFRTARGQGSLLRNALAPVAYWLLTALFDVFPLPRLRGFRRSFAHAGEAMDRGYSILIFPEGTRSRDGLMQSFRPGIGLLAAQSEVPVLPIFLLGLDDLRSRKVRWLRSGRLEVRLGVPVTMPEQTSAVEWTGHLEEIMRRLGA
jgi:long-chain acyl-CoA synthetase